jgi:hypothetical protein
MPRPGSFQVDEATAGLSGLMPAPWRFLPGLPIRKTSEKTWTIKTVGHKEGVLSKTALAVTAYPGRVK